MNVVWETEQGTVQEVLDRLPKSRDLAYTTVMTVLSRLVDKGFLKRQKQGRAYVYRPLVSRERLADSALRTVVNRFFNGLSIRAVDHLIETGESLDEKQLRELESAIRRKRKERGGL